MSNAPSDQVLVNTDQTPVLLSAATSKSS